MSRLDPNEFIEDFLAHAGNYDPQAAHEYYIRTRKLKGRHPGDQSPTPPTKVSGNQNVPPPIPPPSRSFNPPPIPHPSVHQVKTLTDVRVAQVQKRLDGLHSLLEKLLEEAKQPTATAAKKTSTTSTSSTSATKKTASSTSTKSSTTTPSKPQTAAQKAAAKIASKKYYEAHKQLHPRDKALQERIAKVREQIIKVNAELLKAIQNARPSTTPQSSTAHHGR